MTSPLRRLDLGGTACYEDPQAVGISLDGTTADDEVTPHIIGDYNHAPFPNDCFTEAEGSCALESHLDFSELYRVLAPGGKAELHSCDTINPLADDAVDLLEKLFQQLVQQTTEATLAGFEVRVHACDDNLPEIGFPRLTVCKRYVVVPNARVTFEEFGGL